MPIALLYHDVIAAGQDDASGFPGPGAARYKLTDDEFAAHLARLASVDRRVPSTAVSPAADWLLTFDDGGASSLHIADALEARGWRGWFFITTDRLGTPGFLTSAETLELARRGHVIGSHSCGHPTRISQCPAVQLLDEWRRSRSVLEDLLGAPVLSGSVPGGFYSPAVGRAAAAAGLTLLFTSEPTTRLGDVAGCVTCGRYTVYRGMTANNARALRTSRLARWQQAALWSAKKCAKSAGGSLYLQLRERVLQRAYGPASTAR